MSTIFKGPAAALVVLSALSAGCGSPAGDSCQRYGLHIVDCGPCTSWVNVIESTSLQGIQAGARASATVRVGARFQVSTLRSDARPQNCSGAGGRAEPQWISTNPEALQLETTLPPASQFSAIFVAIAPGSATVVANGMLKPSGQLESVSLTTCTSRTPLGECPNRLPLEIVVVP
jgi:hypothetical protein